MHQFPCTSKIAQCIIYPAHLGPVRKVRWISGYVVSTGKNDTAVMIWRQSVNDALTDNGNEVEATAHVASSDGISCHVALYNYTGEVIYPSSGNCVIFDKRNCYQNSRDSFQHEATVSAICSSNTRQLITSSDQNTSRVWNSQTSTEVGRWQHQQHFLSCPISHIEILSFSRDGAQLISVNPDGHICVYIGWSQESSFLPFCCRNKSKPNSSRQRWHTSCELLEGTTWNSSKHSRAHRTQRHHGKEKRAQQRANKRHNNRTNNRFIKRANKRGASKRVSVWSLSAVRRAVARRSCCLGIFAGSGKVSFSTRLLLYRL